MKLLLHDQEVSDVQTELSSENHPGLRLLSAEDFEEKKPVPMKKAAPKRSPWLKELLASFPEVFSDEELAPTKVTR